jgi:hypothetical protein
MKHFFLPTSSEEIALFCTDGHTLIEHTGTRRPSGRYVSALSAYDAATATWVHVSYDDRHFSNSKGVPRTVEVWESRAEHMPSLVAEYLLDPSPMGLIKSIALKDQVLFVAGRFAGGELLALDLESGDRSMYSGGFTSSTTESRELFEWTQLVIEGSQMIAVGEGAPKCMVNIDVSNPRTPRILPAVALQEDLYGRRIHSMAMSAEHLCMATRRYGGENYQDQVSILARSSLRLLQSLSWMYPSKLLDKLSRDFKQLRVELCDELLLLCQADLGVMVVDTRPLLTNVQPWELSALLQRTRRTVTKTDHSAVRAHFASTTQLVISWQGADGSVSNELIACPI